MVGTVVAGLLALGGCGGDDPASGDRATSVDCAPSVTWQGGTYLATPVREGRAVSLGATVAGASQPRCGDRRGTAVTARRLRSVSPAVALAVAGREDQVHVRRGFLPVLAGDPLRRVIVLSAAPRRCGPVRRLIGVVHDAPVIDTMFLADGRPLRVRAGTRVVGFLRAGRPYLQPGDRLAVRARPCDAVGGGRALVADRIRPAP